MTSRTVGVLQPGYLPWLGYYDLAALSDVFVVYDDVQPDKNGWRNRNRLWSKNGPEWVTVPVLWKGSLNKTLRDLRIQDGKWAKKHVQSIRTRYGKAPYFKDCFPVLEEYLLGRKWEWLVELCVEGHKVLGGLIGLESEIALSSELGHRGIGRNKRLIAICSQLGAKRYIATDASECYIDPAQWDEAGIEVCFQRYEPPTYEQFGGEFLSHLSVVDALMFCKPNVSGFLASPRPSIP